MDDLEANPEQWEAFKYQGHCAVLALPGSGKTKLLTTKAVWLANNAIEPGQGVACITLTNPAAAEMRTRIRALGQPVGRTVGVGTVHSFAWTHIIRPFASPAGFPEWADYKLAPRRFEREAMRVAIQRVFGSDANTRYVESTVKRNRKMCLPEEGWHATGPQIRQVALVFESLLREDGYVDFDDVVAMAVQLVEEQPFVRTVLGARYPYLLVDEYQDLAPGLHRIVTSISLGANSTTLFAVGDPDQAIFGWTGTRPELLLDLAHHESVRRVDLLTNYRCGAHIASTSRRILAVEGADAVTTRPGGEVVVRCEPGGPEDQARFVAGRIRALQQSGASLHEIAVLGPTNADCDTAVGVLREAGIPVAWRADVYGQSPLTITLEAFAAWAACGGERTGYRLGELLEQWQQFGDPDVTRAAAQDVVAILMVTAPESSASTFVEAIVEVMERFDMVSQLWLDDLGALEGMRAALDQGGPLETYSVQDLGRLRLRDGRVEVSTMSSSKGLEFDHVFIVALEEGKLPFFASTRGSAEWKEDRRKFYVSFTRARQSVDVLYSGWYRTQYGTKRNGPSVFLREAGLVT
jgi:DNA helicase-2/ATP-dependent DNA helicase PcrA